MNILILNWRDPKHPLAGGAEISLLEHAKYWQKKGATITWFASSFPGATESEHYQGIYFMRKGSHYTVYLWAYKYYLHGLFQKFDKVVDSFHFLPFFTPLYMPKKKIIALINEVAGKVWFANLLLPFAVMGYMLEPLFFLPYRGVSFITGSASAKSDVIKMGIQGKDIHVIHHGFDKPKKINKISKTKNPSLLFLGRISKDKGIEDILQAYKKIIENNSHIELHIAGKEEKAGLLENLLLKYSLNKNKLVHIYGFVSQHEKFSLMQRAWLLLHASTKEGWGLTVIEANSVGTPVVGYNVAGLKDSIQHNKTGLLVACNPNSLVKGVEKLLRNRKQYTLFSKNAISWSKNFNWEKSIKESWSMVNSVS